MIYMSELSSEKKVVLITGASRGLGAAFAEGFSKNGYIVAVNYNKSGILADEVLKKIKLSGGSAEKFKADVSSSDEVKKMISEIENKFGRLDVVVNNAGCIRDRTIIKMSDEEWVDVINTNLKGAFYVLREVASLMVRKKIQGSIINISSIVGARGNFGEANYSASKGALISLTKTAAKELGRKGICVNCVLPGFHRTDMGISGGEEYYKKNIEESVLRTTTSIDELVAFIIFLSQLKTVSGQVFNVDSRIL